MTKRPGTMTDKQRVEALLRREKPDRVPIYPFALGFAMVYAKISVADAFNNPEASFAGQRKTCKDFGWIFLPVMGYASFGSWEFGGEIKWPSAEFDMAPMVTRHPVETEEDVWELKAPDVKTAGYSHRNRNEEHFFRNRYIDEPPPVIADESAAKTKQLHGKRK